MLTQLQYIGSEKLDGLECDRLRLTHIDFNRDIWIYQGEGANVATSGA